MTDLRLDYEKCAEKIVDDIATVPSTTRAFCKNFLIEQIVPLLKKWVLETHGHNCILLDMFWYSGPTFCYPGKHQKSPKDPMDYFEFSSWFELERLILYRHPDDIMSQFSQAYQHTMHRMAEVMDCMFDDRYTRMTHQSLKVILDIINESHLKHTPWKKTIQKYTNLWSVFVTHQ